MKPDYDVVIAGAGLIGLSMAVALGQKAYRVCLIESGAIADHEPTYNGLRVSAISRLSENFLTSMNAWQSLPEKYATPFNAMRVWDADDAAFSDRALSFHSADVGELHLGTIVYNEWLQWALLEQLRSLATVDVWPQTALTEAAVDTAYRSRVSGIASALSINCGERQTSCHLLIGADGARSQVRHLAGIEIVHKSYHQNGVVASITTEKPHRHTAWQRFLSTGPVALLPLADELACSIVWSTSKTESQRLLNLDDSQFLSELTDATDRVLGEITQCSERASFPLSMQYAKRYVQPHIALVGDAAHVVHPLAGQGANMGFADVEKLIDCMQCSRDRGDGLGDLYGLRRYERARKYENRKMQLTLDALHGLFGSNKGFVEHMRSVGMGAVNSVPRIKNFLARQAML